MICPDCLKFLEPAPITENFSIRYWCGTCGSIYYWIHPVTDLEKEQVGLIKFAEVRNVSDKEIL